MKKNNLRNVASQLRPLVGNASRLMHTARFVGRLSKRDLVRGRLVLPLGATRIRIPLDRAWSFPSGDYWEHDVALAFDKLLRASTRPVAYDIGANVGYFTLRASAVAQEIVAFEPGDGAREILLENVARNGLTNVVTFAEALADRDGQAELSTFSSSGLNSIVARSPDSPRWRSLGTRTVATARLDTVVRRERLPLPTFMKIDVEGAEMRVLQGAAETLSRAHPDLLIEHSDRLAAQAGYDLDALFSILEEHGYRVAALPDGRHWTRDLASLRTIGKGTVAASVRAATLDGLGAG